MKTDEGWFTSEQGQRIYQSGNDAYNPNGFKSYNIKGDIIWAYSYKDALLRKRKGLR